MLKFFPFVASADGQQGVEAGATLKIIASRLATKWQKSYSRTFGYFKSRININLLWSTHRCIQGSRMPERQISAQRPQWEDSAGLNLLL